MKKNLKWIKNDVTTERRNSRCLIAKFDTSDYWFCYYANAWTGLQIKVFREVAKMFDASQIEIKYEYDENDQLTEPEENIISIVSYISVDNVKIKKFRVELDVPEGHRREFKYFTVEELKICEKF